MLFDEFRTYIENQEQDVLAFEPKAIKEEDNEYHVIKSKVVYGFWCEDSADEEEDVKNLANEWFSKMHDKAASEGLDFEGGVKFKKGKENKKTGDISRFGCYEVTVKIVWEK